MAKANQVSIPYLDPSVQHVGISKLRALNVTQLRDMDKTLVIQDNDKPLAVLLKHEHFMAIQDGTLQEKTMPNFFTFDDGLSYFPISDIASFRYDDSQENKGGTLIELTDGHKLHIRWSVTEVAEKLGPTANLHY